MKQVRWRKSSFSGGNGGECVELAHTLAEVRDSKNPSGPTLVGRIDSLVAAVKNGTLGH
ncbi:DUF397 domain-containing protein [Actinokineospora diospyrosa]|uniref:DUF397 domain-containing protein n=1 Tax=Actinokineospora diospyrosa TaxID=103728 RepID=A0ABT1IF95_9PSEU|nr:DUF397 domain-containing protein [Actinokineospora diospyrosa]MCP2271313.1 protein of unknown function (DUF397) [Actinokineospora diospyrosa]